MGSEFQHPTHEQWTGEKKVSMRLNTIPWSYHLNALSDPGVKSPPTLVEALLAQTFLYAQAEEFREGPRSKSLK